MRVISKTKLRDYWGMPGRGDSESQLLAWYCTVRKAEWGSFAELKETYATASMVGDCVVFNIRGNKYRLVTRIRFIPQKVFILKIMTHPEYDRSKWKTECGCYTSADEANKKAPMGDSLKQEQEESPIRRKKGGN